MYRYLCPHCKKEVVKSEINEYAWQCVECDEDFYDIEIIKEAINELD